MIVTDTEYIIFPEFFWIKCEILINNMLSLIYRFGTGVPHIQIQLTNNDGPDLFPDAARGHVGGVAEEYGAVVANVLLRELAFDEALGRDRLLATGNHLVDFLYCQPEIRRLETKTFI